MKISIAGENSLILYFGDKADPNTSSQIQLMAAELKNRLANILIDLIPSYSSLLIIYDAFKTDHHEVRKFIRATQVYNALCENGDSTSLTDGKLVTLPVYYSTESGPDLENLASGAGLSIEEIITLHQATEYRVYAIGFAPGFAYLGTVDERIATPRLSTPRTKVPRGAVAIADRQTAVYPAESPGGWNLIGLCPTTMFDPSQEPCMPFQVGDKVRFEPISREQFIELGGSL